MSEKLAEVRVVPGEGWLGGPLWELHVAGRVLDVAFAEPEGQDLIALADTINAAVEVIVERRLDEITRQTA